MDDDDIFLVPDGQSSDSCEEEEEEDKLVEINEEKSFIPETIPLSINNSFAKIDFSEYDELSQSKNFPSNVINLLDQYLDQYLNYVNKEIAISSDNLELFNQNLNFCCRKAEASAFKKNEEKKKFEFEFKIRLATFFLISFMASKDTSDSSNFLQILNQFDELVERKEPDFFLLQKRYCILFSSYLVMAEFDSFERISGIISWASFSDDFSFENELFAPYICIADGIKCFYHNLYKQAAYRSITAFNLFPETNLDMKKKCMVLYYFSSFFLTSEIEIIPKSNQNFFEDYILSNRSIDLISNPSNKKSSDYSPSQQNNSKNSAHQDDNSQKSRSIDDKIYFDDENIKLILQFVKYHMKRDYEIAKSKSKEFVQQIGKTYSFVLHIPYNILPMIIKKRAIIQFLAVYRRVQIDFIFRNFSFNSIEETRNFMIGMIRKKEIKHFLSDSTDTLEIDNLKNHKELEKNDDSFNELKIANGLLNSFVNSFL